MDYRDIEIYLIVNSPGSIKGLNNALQCSGRGIIIFELQNRKVDI